MSARIRFAILLVMAALLALGLFSGCSGGGPADQATATPAADQTTSAPAPATTEPETTTAPPSGEAEIDKSDIELTVKIKSRKCVNYETMPDECDIEYKIDATVDRTGWPSEGTLDVTYEVHGGIGDPDQSTLTMNLSEGTYEQDGYQYTTTRSAKTKLTAKIVDLEYSEY